MSWGYFHCGRLKASRHKIGRILAEKKNGYLGKGLQNAETDFECNISIKGWRFFVARRKLSESPSVSLSLGKRRVDWWCFVADRNKR